MMIGMISRSKSYLVCCYINEMYAITVDSLLSPQSWSFPQNISHIDGKERVAEWLRRLTRKPKVRTAVGSNPTLDSLVTVCNTSPGRPEPCEGNLVAVTGSCDG